jgi:nucleotide-binding universal stress UspA family protein
MVVGVDGSAAAAAALGWAERLAALVDADLVVANVFEPGQAELPPADDERLLAEAARLLREDWTAPLRARGVRHRTLQLAGAPDTLLDATDAAHADLLVVGTRGTGRHAGLHIGSLAHHLAHHTRGPLAIVPAEGASAPIDRIVVVIDGSPGSLAAVRWCTDFAAVGAEVTAVCVFAARSRWSSADDVDTRIKAETAISEEWIESLQVVGGAVRCRVVEDRKPLDAIELAADEVGAGLFVMGARGLSPVLGLRLGRVPMQLVHHTRLPVVLVPDPTPVGATPA